MHSYLSGLPTIKAWWFISILLVVYYIYIGEDKNGWNDICLPSEF